MTFADDLLNWYFDNHRDLPWRRVDALQDPYKVWLSEIMLQQTTVAAVKAYYEKFLNLWPTVNDLAAAPLEIVLKEWAGLGYYARARNLHKCAGVVTNELNGKFPSTQSELIKLPGIGDYSSAAIAAIAYGERAVVVDGNVERIVSRIHRLQNALPGAKKEIKTLTETITPDVSSPSKHQAHFPQAMMDLGATVCTPKKPSCLLCPVRGHCKAHSKGDMETYPIKTKKKKIPTRRAVAFAAIHDEQVLLERRPESGMLGGMAGLFHTPWIERKDIPTQDEWVDHIPTEAEWRSLEGTAKHTFTHFHLESELVVAQLDTKPNIENGFWHPIDDIVSVGLPTVFTKIIKLLK